MRINTTLLFVLIGSCALCAAALALFQTFEREAEQVRASCQSPGVTQLGDTLLICGPLTFENIQLPATDYSQVSQIIVSSGGGESAVALEIARLLIDYDIDLFIDGVCLSACAHFILPARTTVEISQNSVIGFHHTQTAMAQTALAAFGEVAQSFQRAETAEVSYYKTLGIAPELLRLPFDYLPKRSLSYDPERDDQHSYSLTYSNHNFVTFDAEFLRKRFGVELIGGAMYQPREPDGAIIGRDSFTFFVPELERSKSKIDQYCLSKIEPLEGARVLNKPIVCSKDPIRLRK